MPLVWTTDKIITINNVKYRLKTPIEIELYGRPMGDIDIVISYTNKDTGYEGEYYFRNEGDLDDQIIKCIQMYRYNDFFLEHLEAIPTVEEICTHINCKTTPTKYKYFGLPGQKEDKFAFCDKHYDEITELISRL